MPNPIIEAKNSVKNLQSEQKKLHEELASYDNELHALLVEANDNDLGIYWDKEQLVSNLLISGNDKEKQFAKEYNELTKEIMTNDAKLNAAQEDLQTLLQDFEIKRAAKNSTSATIFQDIFKSKNKDPVENLESNRKRSPSASENPKAATTKEQPQILHSSPGRLQNTARDQKENDVSPPKPTFHRR